MLKTIENIIDILKSFDFHIIEENNNFILLNLKNKDFKIKVFKKYLTESLETLSKKQIYEETILYDEYSLEALIKPTGHLLRFLYKNSLIKEDKINNIRYEISIPTKEYSLFFLDLINRSEYINYKYHIFLRKILREKNLKQVENFCDFLIKKINIFTLKIKSQNPLPIRKFLEIANAFLFNLSYNSDNTIIIINSLQEFPPYRYRLRRSKIEEIEPPRRIYDLDLVHYYQMAISTDNPQLQFLSFYRIIEHFFYDIFHEDLINSIKQKLTNPDFSYKRKKDIEDLINFISRKIKQEYENTSKLKINEQEALFLTLKKYISPNDVTQKIKNFNPELIEYYSKFEVPFSKGKKINFNSKNPEQILKQIADRLYKTRNAIVHSKEDGKKPKYIPFRHDKDLILEIPLIRFIAEEIIISSSEILEV